MISKDKSELNNNKKRFYRNFYKNNLIKYFKLS